MPDNEITFNDDQLLRYSRQIMLPHFGIEGQQHLKHAHVVIIGIGGLGSPAALYLAASGVGTLTLIDFDTVDNSNLQRQVIHHTDSIGDSKTASARKTLLAINPETTINCIDKQLTLEELQSIISAASCVIDATDNFATRYLINRACVSQHIALITAAAIQYEGQITVFDLRKENSACYACLYAEQQSTNEQENTSCSENGILAPVVGILGSMQALEAIKLICDIGETLQNRLLIFDALALQWRSLNFNKDPKCPVCNK